MPNAYTTCYDVDLTKRNTMQLSCVANTVITVMDTAHVEPAIAQAKTQSAAKGLPLLVLSGGSNVILPKQLNACVLMPETKGIQIIEETTDHIDISVQAGESWHDLVLHTVQHGWYGLENLALIPGRVGASPVQNIGAYGVELADYLLSVTAYHLATDSWHTLSKNDCQFTYRDSVFKQQTGEWLITEVTFRLHKDPARIVVNYGDVQTQATRIAILHGRDEPTPLDVMHTIIDIRSSKLPNPMILPNCGSFFKNPIIPTTQFLELKRKFADIVGYHLNKELTKVAAGWLIDKAGLKGTGIAPILTHDKQALVLVNHAKPQTPATQADILATQTHIQDLVYQQFGVRLEREPVWV